MAFQDNPEIDTQRFPKQPSRKDWSFYALWVLRGLLFVVFIAAGGSKLAGPEKMVVLFADIGFGQGFRYLTGVIEVAGALMLLSRKTMRPGAMLLALIMVGAVLTHIFLIGGSAIPAMVLGIMAGAVNLWRR